MKYTFKIPLLPLVVGILLLSISALTRLGLALYAGVELAPFSLWPTIFVKGLWFDVTVATILLAPVCLYEALLPNRWRTRRAHRSLRLGWLWVSIALLLFGAVAEATFWVEFSTRFNFIAVDYLIYTQEVIGNIRQSYPVGWILLGIAAIAALVTWSLAGCLRRIEIMPITRGQRSALVASAIIFPVLSLSLANIDQMEGSTNNFATELSGNGLFTLAAAMRRNELDYDKFYRTMPEPLAQATLKTLSTGPMLAGAAPKAHEQVSFMRQPRNVVLISVESLSASFLGAYGSNKGLTPKLDQLAQEGVQFEKVFATGTRTVRGLEALSLGTPPVPGQAIVRRPKNDHLATIGELLEHQGFSSLFFYGGYGYFDNMNAYFSANDYRVIDRTDFPKESIEFENVWGVADEFLFNNMLRTLDAGSTAAQPFFAHVMTTSNHRPYTYPDGRIDIKSPGGREGAVKYTDYAIGKFINDAKAKPWFKDTLFVIIADHCASVAGKSKLPVANYHIPLIFYAPELLKPGRYAPMMSQIDLVPSLIEALGKGGDDHSFGRSIFGQEAPLERAFISNYQELGYLRNDTLTVLSPKKQVASFHIDPKTYEATPAPIDAQLLNETIAYYQSASRDFKHGDLRASYYKNGKTPLVH